MVVAIVCAVAAGASFATAGVLQQHAASTRPPNEALSFRLLLDLAHDRVWWLGLGFALLSYVLESVALAFGPLVLVQPLIVSELLFALPISIRWRGMHMTRRVWAGTGLVTGGLALGLISAAPGQGRPEAPLSEWAIGLVAVAVLGLAAVAVGRAFTGPVRSSLFAAAAAFALGAQAALLKATIGEFEKGLVGALVNWHLWGMIAAAIVGLLLVQSAYEAGPLATSMPVVDAIDPAVAIVFGISLFHEPVRSGLWFVGIFAGAAGVLAGIGLLDTSPLIQSLQRLQEHQRGATGAGGDIPRLASLRATCGEHRDRTGSSSGGRSGTAESADDDLCKGDRPASGDGTRGRDDGGVVT